MLDIGVLYNTIIYIIYNLIIYLMNYLKFQKRENFCFLYTKDLLSIVNLSVDFFLYVHLMIIWISEINVIG